MPEPDLMARQQNILLVDDDPLGRETMRAQLEPMNCKTILARSGQQALELLAEQPVDVVLLDVMMPGMDGFEVCRHIRAQPQLEALPIILITALDGHHHVVTGLEAGADEFLSKPVRGVELRARVRSMLRIKAHHDALKSMLKMREDMVHMIMHDMRTPLSVIVGLTTQLERRVKPERTRAMLSRISRAADRTREFLEDMLVMARHDEGKLKIERGPVELGALIDGVIEFQSPLARLCEVEVTRTGDDLVWANADERLTQRVLDNLLSNAIKYSPEGKRVWVNLRRLADGRVQVCFLDEGHGIPPELHSRIFNRFEVAPLRKAGVRQVGLGLGFCKLVMEAHDGEISVKNNEPVGTVFTIILPAPDEDATSDERPPAGADAPDQRADQDGAQDADQDGAQDADQDEAQDADQA